MRAGLSTVAETQHGKHPVEEFQQKREAVEFKGKLDFVRKVYGVGAAMGLKAEAQIVGQPTRLPGLEESNLGHDIIMGKDERIDFVDVLGQEQDRPEAPRFQLHSAMEVKLGMM